eukprot:GFYU01002906.1.p1 GENE.GFYU01002906.1~~GFYU01002906.1.p1  ORF type:complete len:472 (+),score=115.39 GFYU01002906.1:51-1418(+)
MEALYPSEDGLRAMFYALTPAESSFALLEEVPDYVSKAVPWFFILMALENLLIFLRKGHAALRFNDGFSSIAAGTVEQASGMAFGSLTMVTYIWTYDKYRFFDIPHDSVAVWIATFLAVDCGYYWFHRYAHEANIFWGAHQVHHSSEEYNLTTALRQSMFQVCGSWIFYLPLAFVGLPPTQFATHKQFNLLYQFWIHTEAITTLGPLEYVLNTPSHHRVHHGRNRYCIDKNYAGTLIIWDRMFGTFEQESEEVVYGLVHPLNSWNPLYTQFCHYWYMINLTWTMPGLSNKLKVWFYGPGWHPGTPRTGLLEEIPDIKAPQPRYNSTVHGFLYFYVLVHFVITLVTGFVVMTFQKKLPPTAALIVFPYLCAALTAFGGMFDHKWWGQLLEMGRIVFFLQLVHFSPMWLPVLTNLKHMMPTLFVFLDVVHGLSLVYMLSLAVREMSFTSTRIYQKSD